jgi:hypothetical protein
MSRDEAKGRYKLVEVGVDPWSTYAFYPHFWLAAVCHALTNDMLGLCGKLQGAISDTSSQLGEEACLGEEMMQGIFADRLGFSLLLVVPRLRPVVDVALSGRPPTLHPLGLASGRSMRDIALV